MRFLRITLLLFTLWPDLSQSQTWEQILSQDGIDLFRAQKVESGIIPFKAIALVDGSLDDYLKLLLDSRGRVEWAPKLDKIVIHEVLGPNHLIYSEFYRTPWPATDRQFLLEGRVIFKGPGHVILQGKNSTRTEFKSPDHILCDVRFLNFELIQKEGGKTKLSFSFLGDMKGWMPNWLINLIQRKWPMRFIQSIRLQVKQGRGKDLSIYNRLKRGTNVIDKNY